jgi:hypothetical protein
VTCRYCKDHHQRSHMITIGPRHNAHLECVWRAGKAPEAISKLHNWSLMQLPFMELNRLGLVPLVKAEAERRNITDVEVAK